MEVDNGPTQDYKKQRVKEILGALPRNVAYAPMDFTKDDLLTHLVKAGYSEKLKTFFVWEGVTEYLPESAVKDTLHFVRDHAAPGSRIAFDYTIRSDPTVNNPNSRYARWGEPWLFGFPGRDAAPYVERGSEVGLWTKSGETGQVPDWAPTERVPVPQCTLTPVVGKERYQLDGSKSRTDAPVLSPEFQNLSGSFG